MTVVPFAFLIMFASPEALLAVLVHLPPWGWKTRTDHGVRIDLTRIEGSATGYFAVRVSVDAEEDDDAYVSAACEDLDEDHTLLAFYVPNLREPSDASGHRARCLNRIVKQMEIVGRVRLCEQCGAHFCDGKAGMCSACLARGGTPAPERRSVPTTLYDVARTAFGERSETEFAAMSDSAATCVVCVENRELSVALACGHVVCGWCASRVVGNACCPMCRSPVSAGYTRIFA